jgi:transglutaminase-like putative cysteine protease
VSVNVQLPSFGIASLERYPADQDNDKAVAQTIALMGSIIEASTEHPHVIDATRAACAGIGTAAPAWRKSQAIFGWIKSNVRFMTDESILAKYFGLGPDQELLIKPELLVKFGRGDCDCHAMLTCAMLRCSGVDCRLVTIAADQEEPERYSHVYAVAVLETGDLLPMDTSHGLFAGWEAPWSFRRQEWGSAWPATPATNAGSGGGGPC